MRVADWKTVSVHPGGYGVVYESLLFAFRDELAIHLEW
jgi:hypothetical protein